MSDDETVRFVPNRGAWSGGAVRLLTGAHSYPLAVRDHGLVPPSAC